MGVIYDEQLYTGIDLGGTNLRAAIADTDIRFFTSGSAQLWLLKDRRPSLVGSSNPSAS